MNNVSVPQNSIRQNLILYRFLNFPRNQSHSLTDYPVISHQPSYLWYKVKFITYSIQTSSSKELASHKRLFWSPVEIIWKKSTTVFQYKMLNTKIRSELPLWGQQHTHTQRMLSPCTVLYRLIWRLYFTKGFLINKVCLGKKFSPACSIHLVLCIHTHFGKRK